MLLLKYPIYNLKICFSATEQFSLIVQLAQKDVRLFISFSYPHPPNNTQTTKSSFSQLQKSGWRMETRDTHYTDFHEKNHEKMLRVASKYKGMGHDT